MGREDEQVFGGVGLIGVVATIGWGEDAGELIHDLIGDGLAVLLFLFAIEGGDGEGIAELGVNVDAFELFEILAVGFVAPHGEGQNGGLGVCGEDGGAWLGLDEMAVTGAGAFGEDAEEVIVF